MRSLHMSNNLKQDVINAVGMNNFIKHLYSYAHDGVCSNIETILKEDINTYYKDKLQLFNVQISTITSTKSNLINKFVYAINEEDAKRLVLERYKNICVEIINVYCQIVDIHRGMIFNA